MWEHSSLDSSGHSEIPSQELLAVTEVSVDNSHIEQPATTNE